METNPSDPSASLPTRKMTAESPVEEVAALSSLLRVASRRERVSICSEMCEGEAGEEPAFHTMAGAAVVRPMERAAVATLSKYFMVKSKKIRWPFWKVGEKQGEV